MKHKYIVEFAVGFNHGSWELAKVEVDVEEDNTANEHEFELLVAATAREKMVRIGYVKGVAFLHLMYFNRTVEEKP